MRQQIVLWQISSQTWTRASVSSWTVGPIDSPDDQIWSKTRESSDRAFIIWEMLTHSNPDHVPNQKEVICLNSNRTPPKSFTSSSTNWAYWRMFQAAENYRIIIMSPDSLMSATYAQCEPAVWYSPDHPLVYICALATILAGTANPLTTESMFIPSWGSYTTIATFMGCRCYSCYQYWWELW